MFGIFVSLGLYIIGFVLFFSEVRFVGNAVMVVGILTLFYQTYLSLQDASRLKYFNAGAKIAIALVLVLMFFAIQ